MGKTDQVGLFFLINESEIKKMEILHVANFLVVSVAGRKNGRGRTYKPVKDINY